MPAPRKYPAELRERAVRLVSEAREQEPELSLNAAVLRMPPFHQPSYGPPERMVAPGLPSAARRECIAAPNA